MDTQNKPQLILLGGGGHAAAVAEVALAQNHYQLLGYIDFKVSESMNAICPYLGTYSELPHLVQQVKELYAVVAVGANRIRSEEYSRWPGLKWATLVHPTAYISPSAKLSEGTVVMPRAIVHTLVTVGLHCIVNSGAVIEHDSAIGDFCHVGPAAVTGAGVRLGDMCFLGLNSTVMPFVTLPDRTTLGAGSTLLKTPPLEGTYVGCPARRLP